MKEKFTLNNHEYIKRSSIKKYSKLNKNLQPKKESRKPIIKKIIILTAVAGVGLGVFFGIRQKVNVKPVYTQNLNVEPGYYNDNPVKVCISDKFSDQIKQGIARGIEYLDESALGIKFEYYFADGQRYDYDIEIRSKDLDERVLGQATRGDLQAKQIVGVVWIDDEQILEYTNSIESVTVHELCHVLGLEHNKNYSSLMYYAAPSAYKELSNQDIENINTIYPPEEMEN